MSEIVTFNDVLRSYEYFSDVYTTAVSVRDINLNNDYIKDLNMIKEACSNFINQIYEESVDKIKKEITNVKIRTEKGINEFKFKEEQIRDFYDGMKIIKTIDSYEKKFKDSLGEISVERYLDADVADIEGKLAKVDSDTNNIIYKVFNSYEEKFNFNHCKTKKLFKMNTLEYKLYCSTINQYMKKLFNVDILKYFKECLDKGLNKNCNQISGIFKTQALKMKTDYYFTNQSNAYYICRMMQGCIILAKEAEIAMKLYTETISRALQNIPT